MLKNMNLKRKKNVFSGQAVEFLKYNKRQLSRIYPKVQPLPQTTSFIHRVLCDIVFVFQSFTILIYNSCIAYTTTV